jgi:glycerate 2-kinase
MSERIRRDAAIIINESIKSVLPERAVINALSVWKDEQPNRKSPGKLLVIAIGKAAWNMAKAAGEILSDDMDAGLVITKYGHSKGQLRGFEIIEAGHPLPDFNSITGADKAIELVKNAKAHDTIILLLSGGGSSLFEKPAEGVSLDEIMGITRQLLESGADISEINTIRKRLSSVKGGKFAVHCGQAQIYAVVLSDVIGDRLDMIASGPAYPDSSTSDDVSRIIERYHIETSESLRKILMVETPKKVTNCRTVVIGNVGGLCEAAARSAQKLGYHPIILTTTLNCEAREAGRFMAAIAREIKNRHAAFALSELPCALIAGGETVVQLKGKGKGGRNQEVALAAAIGIGGLDETVVISVGSDGTDGPTDAAGGIVDSQTVQRIKTAGLSAEISLEENDAYHALQASGDLIMTGATGTNVNDFAMVLCR